MVPKLTEAVASVVVVVVFAVALAAFAVLAFGCLLRLWGWAIG